MCTHKMRALSYVGADKITFPPKPDRHTCRRTDINVYRVASLLLIFSNVDKKKLYVVNCNDEFCIQF